MSLEGAGQTRMTGLSGVPVVAVATLVVLGLCAAMLALHGVGEEGVRACIRVTARVSAAFLLVVVPASALHRRWRSPATRWPRSWSARAWPA